MAIEYKEYGHYSKGGTEYTVTERKTPRHWYNYYFNERFNSFMSQVGYGEAIVEDYLGNRVWIASDRCVYICDKEAKRFHTAVGLPMTESFDFYECRHGLGYSTIECEKNGVRSEYTVFVPDSEKAEHWIIKLTNTTGEKIKRSLVTYTATETDNVYRAQSYNSDGGYFDKENNLIYATAMSRFEASEYQTRYIYMVANQPIAAYDTRKNAFIGTYGTKDAPEALIENCGCTCSDCYVEKLCYALEFDCELEAGQSKVFHVKIGAVCEKAELSGVRASTLGDTPENLLCETVAKRAAEVDGITIRTPDEKLNLAFNSFYKYSTNMGSRWARVRHNGYRDRMGDTESLSCINPELAKQRFLTALEYQYSNGYAPRTVIDGAIRPNNFSDCAVWIAMTAHAIFNELGDPSFLETEVPFNDGSVASVYEHVRRSVEYLYNFKAESTGLIKIWGGDWNDGMNLAGLQGKGSSVWLSIAWCYSNKLFCEMARFKGELETVKLHEEWGRNMVELIEKYGWDGKYYITAINDWGDKIGSKDNKYGKMYLNPQTWAIFADIAPKEKLRAIYDEVEDYLETPLGTLVNKPGYEESDCHVGFMTFRPVGSLINSSVYLHPMAWKVIAEAKLGRADRLEMTLKKMLPWDHDYGMTYGEPYMLYNFYHCPETGYREGTPGQSWRTGSTSTLTKAIVRSVFGLVARVEGLSVEPCLPCSWKECGIVKSFRGAVYDISYFNGGSGNQVEKITVDGKDFFGEVLPYEKGKHYEVKVYVK